MAEESAQAATTTQATAQAAETTTAQTGSEQDLASLPEWARKTIEKLNREDAGNRLKAKDRDEVASQLKKLQDEKLSESEKLANRAKELETAAATRDTDLRQERAARQVEREARKLNIVDEETALLLIQGKLEFDDKGAPTNIPKLLEQLVKDKPFLIVHTHQSPGNAGNPSGGRPGTFTLEHFKGKSPEYINLHWDEYVKDSK